MHVLKDTFNGFLPILQDAINLADFIAIDTELTGLSAGPSTNYAALDTPQERYAKLRQSSQRFTISQYGVSCFIWDSLSNSYISRPFNFYLFPCTAKFPFAVYERNFLCQVGSIEFLAKNGFDFNTWIRHGIPYCSKENESYIRTQIAGQSNSENDIVVDNSNREFVESSLNRVQEWLQSSAEKTIDIETQNSYHKKLLIQQIQRKYTTFLAVNTKERSVEVTRLNDEERQRGLGDPTLQLEKTLDEYIGFRKVIDMISSSGKPMIGHNMLLDLTHTYNSFIGVLPDTWEEFKSRLNKDFPIIYDTKHICKMIPELESHFSDSSLEKVFTTVNQHPFVEPTIRIHPDHSRYGGDAANYHEAGWDAHATGFAFARLVAQFQEHTTSHPRASFGDDRTMGLLNRLNIMRSDLAYLHLSGADDQPDRSSILHIYDMPKVWKNKDIESLFDTTKMGAITIQWINGTSAFIRFEDSAKSEAAMNRYIEENDQMMLLTEEECKEMQKGVYTLQRYADMRKAVDGLASRSNGTKKESSVPLKRSASNSADTPNKQVKVS